MKKLLTVLLTLVMAMCLINLNNSHTKAEGSNVDITESIGISEDTPGSPILKYSGGSAVPSEVATIVKDGDWYVITLHSDVNVTGGLSVFNLAIDFGKVKIVIDGDRIITNDNLGNPTIDFYGTDELVIEGNGVNTLTVTNNGGGTGVYTHGKPLKISNINIVASTNGSSNYGINCGSLSLDHNSRLKATTSGDYAICGTSSTAPNAYSQKGYSSTGPNTSLNWTQESVAKYGYTVVGSSSKATYVELNYEPLYELTDTGFIERNSKTIYDSGDVVTIMNSSASKELKYHKNGTYIGTLNPGDSQTMTFNYNQGMVKIKGNDVYFVDKAPTQCDGITFDGSTWKNGANTIDATELKNTFGIEYNNITNTVTLSKSLNTSSNDNAVLYLSSASKLNIVLSEDISLVHTNATNPGSALYVSKEFSVNGNGKKIVLKTGGSNAMTTMYKDSEWNNVNLVCENNSDSHQTLSLNNLDLKDNCEIEVINRATGTNARSLTVAKEPASTVKDNYNFFGKVNFTDGELKESKWVTGAPVGTFKVNSGTEASPNWVVARYTKITPIQKPSPTPTPSPSPSKKDESCEKVIGPTWHWNNTKGICEDYGVVGTYTR